MEEIKYSSEYTVKFDLSDSDFKHHRFLTLFLFCGENHCLDLELRPLNSDPHCSEFYQRTIISSHPKNGYGSTIQDFIIEKRDLLPIKIQSLFSSNINDGHFSVDAKAFWDKQVEKGKAEFIRELQRYKLIFL